MVYSGRERAWKNIVLKLYDLRRRTISRSEACCSALSVEWGKSSPAAVVSQTARTSRFGGGGVCAQVVSAGDASAKRTSMRWGNAALAVVFDS